MVATCRSTAVVRHMSEVEQRMMNGVLGFLLMGFAFAGRSTRLSRSRSSQTSARSSSRFGSIQGSEKQSGNENVDSPDEVKDERFQNFEEEARMLKVVRRDMIQYCTPKLHAELLRGFRLSYRQRFMGFGPKEVVINFRKKMTSASYTEPRFFLEDPPPVTESDVCILKTEFYLREMGKEEEKLDYWYARPKEEPYRGHNDGKPLVDLSRSCYVQQTLHQSGNPSEYVQHAREEMCKKFVETLGMKKVRAETDEQKYLLESSVPLPVRVAVVA